MDTNWAAEHLQVIRTLMERSAVYRRALAPIMILNGVLGTIGALIGTAVGVDTPRNFILFWGCVAAVALTGSFFLVRRQALKASEPFWSPPTRRITQAMLPGLVAGGIIGTLCFFMVPPGQQRSAQMVAMLWLPVGWVILYGCAFHAAGFFMPRGMKIFGWTFIIGGCCSVLSVAVLKGLRPFDFGYGMMGFFFGLLHLAYGTYLYFTEKRRNEK
jgi:hypothetical protein